MSLTNISFNIKKGFIYSDEYEFYLFSKKKIDYITGDGTTKIFTLSSQPKGYSPIQVRRKPIDESHLTEVTITSYFDYESNEWKEFGYKKVLPEELNNSDEYYIDYSGSYPSIIFQTSPNDGVDIIIEYEDEDTDYFILDNKNINFNPLLSHLYINNNGLNKGYVYIETASINYEDLFKFKIKPSMVPNSNLASPLFYISLPDISLERNSQVIDSSEISINNTLEFIEKMSRSSSEATELSEKIYTNMCLYPDRTDDYDKKPLWYAYILKYPHKKKGQTVLDDIKIVDLNGNMEIVDYYINSTETDSEDVFSISLFFNTYITKEKTLLVKYNRFDNLNNISYNYTECINLEEISKA